MNKSNEFAEWLKVNDPQVQYSSLWEEMKQSFEDDVLRGYGVNTEKDYVKLERALIVLSKMHHILIMFQERAVRYISALISLILTGSRKKYRSYGFHYGVNIRDAVFAEIPAFRPFYEDYCKNYGEFYSYSGMRVLYYYFLAREFIGNPKPKVLEIGGGLGNFSIITSRHYDEFEYVILDIPEIIPSAYANVQKFVSCDTELYFPNEYDQFKDSTSKRKILWVIPSQIDNFKEDYFDFFCNTESFAEMDPSVAEGYWSKIGRLLKEGSYAFLINRATRFTSAEMTYSVMSSPFKLNNPLLKVENIMVDQYRSVIPKFQEKPNLVLAYKVKKS